MIVSALAYDDLNIAVEVLHTVCLAHRVLGDDLRHRLHLQVLIQR